MAKCPFCAANLGPSDLQALKCLACGGSLASLPELDPAALKTISDESSPQPAAALGRTLDEASEPFSGVAPAMVGGATIEETPTENEQAPDKTLASGEFTLPQEQEKIGTVGDARLDQTLQSTDLPVDLTSGTVSPQASGRVDQTLDSDTFPPVAVPPGEKPSVPAAPLDQTLDSDVFPPVAAEEPTGTGTVSEVRLDQTLDSDNFPPVSEKEEGGTVHGHRLDQTLDSGSFAPVPPPAGHGTVHDDPSGGTHDADAVGPAPPGTGTVSEGRIDQTLDSTELAAAKSEERKTVSERLVAQTVEAAAPVAAGEPKTIAERRVAATLDSAELASADMVKVSQMWEGSFTGRDTPMTSLKAKSPPAEVAANMLVVAQRALRGAGVKATKPADYDLIRQLGEGGMGIIYEARQMSIGRKVAIKTLKPKTAKDKQQRDKFQSEAVVTGGLDHPNIVPIYDLGTTEEGALFYSMKKVEGKEWLKEIGAKSRPANIEILMKVADAIAFAHSKGVVHRDLKPENIMLGGFGEVLVMDWGLAIYVPGAERPAGIKQSVSMGGTPAYMAPEMAAGPFEKISPASDVYLLGAILYEIIGGKPPHTGADVMKCLFAAAKNQIQPTEEKGELVEIALKAMATNIADRYQTVQEFQNAIREYQSHHESIVLSTQADEDLRRAATTNDYQDYQLARFGFKKAVEMWSGNERARHGLSEANLATATFALHKGDLDLGLSLLNVDDPAHEELVGQIQTAKQEREARQQRLQTQKRFIRGGLVAFFITVTVGFAFVTYFGIAANRQKVLALASEATAKQEKVEADIARDTAKTAEASAISEKNQADIARDKAKTAEANAISEKNQADIARDKAKTAEELALAAEKQAKADKEAAEYQAYIALIGLADAKIKENAHDTAKELLERYKNSPLVNWEWGRLMRLCNQSKADYSAVDKIEAVAFDPKGERFVTGGWSGEAQIWKVDPKVADKEKLLVATIKTGGSRVNAVAFSPTESEEGLVATGTDLKDGYIRLWNATTGERLAQYFDDQSFASKDFQLEDGSPNAVLSLAFSKDGKHLLSSWKDGSARLWSLETRTWSKPLAGHDGAVYAAAFSPQEDRIVTVSEDGTALIWTKNDRPAQGDRRVKVNEDEWQSSPPFLGHQGPVYTAAFSIDGNYVATGGYDKRVLVWEPSKSKLKRYDFKAHNAEYARRLKERENSGAVADLAETGLGKLKIAPEQKIAELVAHTDRVQAVRFSADGKFLFSAGHDNAINVWDAERAWADGSKSLLKTLRGHGSPVRSCAVAKDGSLVLSGSYDETAKLWDVRKYEEMRVLSGKGLRHEEEVLAAAFAGVGERFRIITASQDRTAKVWRLDTAAEKAALIEEKQFVVDREFIEGHMFLASTGLFLDGDKKLLTCGVDRSARIWDVATGTELRKLSPTGDNAVAAASPDGKWVLTGGNKIRKPSGEDVHTALLWNMVVQEVPVVLEGYVEGKKDHHASPVTAVAFSPDGTVFFTGDNNGTGRLWNTSTRAPIGAPLKGAKAHVGMIVGAAFLDDGKRLLTASVDHTVGHWDLTQKPPVRLEKLTLGHPKGVKSLAVTSDARFAITSCDDNQVRLWDVAQAKEVRSPISLTKTDFDRKLNKQVEVRLAAGAVAFSRDDKRAIFVVDEDHSVYEFPVGAGTQQPKSLLRLHHSVYIRSAIFAPDNTRVLTVGGNEARLWDPSEVVEKRKEKMRFSPHGVVASASFSPNGKYVVTASWDHSARIWRADLDEPKTKHLLIGHEGHVNCAQFSPDLDGRLVLTASDDGTTRLWDAEKGTQLKVFRDGDARVKWAAFSHDGKFVATASSDNIARLWKVDADEALALVGKFEGHRSEVLHVSFSTDDAKLVTGSSDNEAWIWDVKAPKPLIKLVGHRSAVNSVAFSPDGKRVITGSDDFTAKIWDAEKGQEEKGDAKKAETPRGQEVLTLFGHQREVMSVAFSSDGLYALTGSRDNKAIVWTADEWKDNKAQPAVEAAAAK